MKLEPHKCVSMNKEQATDDISNVVTQNEKGNGRNTLKI